LVHPLPSAHVELGAQLPPQSLSVSVPFLTPSLHAGGEQTCDPEQTPLWQSPATKHPSPSEHFDVVEHVPPQSTSVSVPFLTPSLQADAEQKCEPGQTPLVQSAAIKHPLPSAQVLPGAHVPPQSVSVSFPFFTLSVQTGAAQM